MFTKSRPWLLAASLAACGTAHAGPFILAGTDADDHGSASTTANLDGWLFMQKAIENIAASLASATPKKLVSLGSDAGTQAGLAAASAFAKSSLASSGWTFTQVSTLTNANFASSIAGAGIIMLDSGSNVVGGLTTSEEAVLTAHASDIDSFVGGGGGLFSQAGDYGWLSALVPGLVVDFLQDQGLALTSAGSAAFPGLTNADLSAGPYHENFRNIGAISVLATGEIGTLNVVIGSSGGSITAPVVAAIPEPSTYALMLGGVGALALLRRKVVSRG